MNSLKITTGQITDKGLNPKRLVNEDNLLALPKRGLFLVADGVGGRRGGRIASQTVVDVFTRVFNQEHLDDPVSVITGTIDLCNQKIYEDSLSNPELDGMATTLALVAVDGRRAVVAHVGDSRVYRFDDQGLICLTEDHSEVNEALRAGVITEEQAINHPRRNVINRAIGAEPEVDPDIIQIDLDENTSLLLCSDGVTRHVSDEDILRLMSSGRRPQEVCEMIKEICYEGGAEDNLTAIIVDFGERNYVEQPTRPARVARANAAPGGGLPIPQPAKRIEVSLARPSEDAGPTVEAKTGKSSKLGCQNKIRADVRPAVPPAGEETFEKRKPQSQIAAGAKTGRTPAQKGELSELMKWSLLIGTLIAGILLGSLFGKPIADQFDRLVGGGKASVTPNDAQPQGDAEVMAAYARYIDGKPDEARERLNNALAASPSNAAAHYYLGLIDYDQGKFEEAVNHLSQAAKLDPKLPNIQVRLAMAYISVGQMRNARDLLQQVVAPGSIASPAPIAPPPASPASGKPVG